MTSRVSHLLFGGVAVTAALAVLFLPVLFALTPAFAGKAAGVAACVGVCVERAWAMYFRRGMRSACDGAGRDWTAIAVGYAYVLTLVVAAFEFLLRRVGLCGWWVLVGSALYGAGVGLRYWAFHVLRNQWRVDVSDVSGERHLVQEGPYRYMRHPLYLGACLAAIGLPVFLGAWGALAFGVLVFLPLEVIRAYYEERFLRDLFGTGYRNYAAQVWAFLPMPFKPGKLP